MLAHRLSPHTRAAVLDRDGHRCTVSRLLGGECSQRLDVHHIVPRREGGGDELDNLASVCASHHPRWEALRRAILNERGDNWRCPHVHPTSIGREACERQHRRMSSLA